MNLTDDPGSGAPSIRGDVVAAVYDDEQSSLSARAPKLSLTDFLDVETLQEIQDSFTAVTRLSATILDAEGQPVTAPTDTRRRTASDRMLEQLISPDTDEQGRYLAPIVVEGQQLGSIAVQQQSVTGLEKFPECGVTGLTGHGLQTARLRVHQNLAHGALDLPPGAHFSALLLPLLCLRLQLMIDVNGVQRGPVVSRLLQPPLMGQVQQSGGVQATTEAHHNTAKPRLDGQGLRDQLYINVRLIGHCAPAALSGAGDDTPPPRSPAGSIIRVPVQY